MFPTDTKILTKDDWKGHDTLSTKDLVATFNRSSGEIEYQCPTDIQIILKYKGELIHIKHQNTNQLLTSDHRVLLKKPFRKGYPNQTYHWDSYWSFETVKAFPRIVKAKNELKLPLAGKYKQGTLSIGKEYAELLGWILMDGSFLKNCRAVEISQSSVHPKKVNRIRFLLDHLNVKYSDHIREKYYSATTKQMEVMHKFYLNASDFTDRIRRDIPDKKPTWDLLQLLPSEIAGKKAPSLLTGLLGGDGSLYAKSNKKKDRSLKNTCTFTQKDDLTRAWIQALCVLIGCRSKDSPDRFQVAICGRDTIGIIKNHVTIERTRTPLKVWGVETENQSVICRRTTIEQNRAGKRIKKAYVFITGATLIE